MINILFDCPNLADFKEELAPYFSQDSRVAVVAFSYSEDYVYDAATWEKVYGKGVGNCYFETVDDLAPFGVKEENVVFINYFTDTKESARQKIEWANVVYFTGGLPDRMMDRIIDFDLVEPLKKFDGVVVGYSAGAVIQLAEYHLYPDGDYTDYAYYTGLGYIDHFYLEVHYEYKPEQDKSIALSLSERSAPLYVTHTRKGGVVVENGNIHIIGTVDYYTP